MSRHTHEQDTPATVWEIRHNLYTRTPVVDCYVEVDGVLQKVLPLEVRSITLTECHVHWSTPRSGKAGVA